jgi:hypothetical protein
MEHWKVRALEILDFHEARIAEHGEPLRSNRKTGWSIKDTAKALGWSEPTIIEDIRIGKYLRNEPEVIDGARSRTEALRMINRRDKMNVEVEGLHGVLVKTIKLDKWDYYIVKLNNPLVPNIKMICVPMYLVKHYDKR